MFWRPRTAPSIDSEEARLQSLGWEAAQNWCNFVLMRPTDLPPGLALIREAVRPEAPPGRRDRESSSLRPTWSQSNRATHRCELGEASRTLRIKQFLYDFGPPAFDHPSLWQCDQVRGFPVGSHMGWLGWDFLGRPAASLQVDRTMVEVAVTAGSFSDNELESLLRGLRPVSESSRARVLATSLAELSYQRRHREPPVGVPVGYWAHSRRPANLEIHAFRAEEIPPHLAPPALAPKSGYHLESVFTFGNLERPQEIEWVFEHVDDRGRYVRLLTSPASTPDGIPFPPQREERQPCSSRVLEVHGQQVFHAYLDPRCGQHEAVWQKEGVNRMMIVKPTPWTDLPWFEAFLEEVV